MGGQHPCFVVSPSGCFRVPFWGHFSCFWGISTCLVLGFLCPAVLGILLHFGVSAWPIWGDSAWPFWGVHLHFGVPFPGRFGVYLPYLFWGIFSRFWGFSA